MCVALIGQRWRQEVLGRTAAQRGDPFSRRPLARAAQTARSALLVSYIFPPRLARTLVLDSPGGSAAIWTARLLYGPAPPTKRSATQMGRRPAAAPLLPGLTAARYGSVGASPPLQSPPRRHVTALPNLAGAQAQMQAHNVYALWSSFEWVPQGCAPTGTPLVDRAPTHCLCFHGGPRASSLGCTKTKERGPCRRRGPHRGRPVVLLTAVP